MYFRASILMTLEDVPARFTNITRGEETLPLPATLPFELNAAYRRGLQLKSICNLHNLSRPLRPLEVDWACSGLSIPFWAAQVLDQHDIVTIT